MDVETDHGLTFCRKIRGSLIIDRGDWRRLPEQKRLLIDNMDITADNRLRRLIVVGDRVLVKPKNPSERTNSGLYLPPTVTEKEQVQSGYVIKVGPGYPIPTPTEDEPWKETEEKVKYMPLQALEGDLAIYLQRNAIELEYEGEKYCIVPQSAILLLERSENLFD